MFTTGDKVILGIAGAEIVAGLGIAMACYKKANQMVKNARKSNKPKRLCKRNVRKVELQKIEG